MRSNELRIGNWVQCAIIKIGSLKKGDFHQVEIDDFNYNLEDYFRPIPLTEEWLIKFGFEKSIDGFEMSKDITIRNNNGWVKEMVFFQIDDGLCGVSLRDIYDSGEKETYVIEIDIEYVHQLQNLFWCLTGTELQIKST